MKRAHIKNALVSRNKKLYVPFYILILLTIACLYTYILLVKNMSKISINFVQSIGFFQREIEINTTWDIYTNGIQVNQLAILSNGRDENLPKDLCYKETVKRITENVTSEIAKRDVGYTLYANTKHFDNNTGKIIHDEILNYAGGKCGSGNQNSCKKDLIGQTPVLLDPIPLKQLASIKNLSFVKPGGWWLPTNCKSKRSIAIIIPFRDRDEHLAIFLRHMHPILKRQQLHYRIIVIEQVDAEKFNRGKLMNVGYAEALRIFPYDCFVFHDVDLVLEDDRNNYGCFSSPQHLSIAIDKFKYKILYEELFGGIEMFSRAHFELVNGFSNSFWGWGAEDDNLYRRLAWKKLDLWRSSTISGRYKMLSHNDAEASADMSRFTLRKESYKHYSTDGLVNLQYDVKQLKELPFHTHIKVDLRKDKDKMFGVMPFPPK